MRKTEQQKYSQSLFDFIVDHFPDFQKQIKNKMLMDGDAASKLLGIWKKQENAVGKRIFKKPENITSSDISNMQKEGLIRLLGDKIEITAKGSEVIKTLILGDERSVYEDNGKDIDIRTASANVNTRSKKQKRSSDLWWDRF